MAETLKQETEGFPDLEAAYEAVKGVLFGPLDAATVKLKFNEIVKDTKEKRELEMDPRAALGGARVDREDRDRKDRDHQHLTLTVLLASNAAYRAAHERAMQGLPELGRGLDDLQDEIDEALDNAKQALKADLERVAGRLPDGSYVFKGDDGSIVDKDLKPLKGADAEAAKDVDFTGKMTLEEYRERKGKIDRLETMAGDNRRDRVRIGEIHEDLTDQKNPPSQETVESHAREKDEIKERLDQRQEDVRVHFGSPKETVSVEAESVSPTAAIAPLKL